MSFVPLMYFDVYALIRFALHFPKCQIYGINCGEVAINVINMVVRYDHIFRVFREKYVRNI